MIQVKNMKIGIYCRVSTEEQRIKGVSLNDQQQRGIDFCERNYYKYEVFEDGGFSGELQIVDRPGLNKLFDKIYSEEIQGIYIVDFDRLSRDENEGFVIKNTLITNKIRLFDTTGEINLKDESQNLLLGMKILLASFENQRTRVRIKRSLERGVIDGKAGGGPLMNYGYMKDENKKLIVNEKERPVVELIYQLSIEGKGTKVIANYLNEKEIPTKRSTSKTGYMKVRGEKKTQFKWRDSVVYRILTNSIYKGERLYKDNIYKCPSIVSKDVFDMVQELLKERKNLVDTTNKYFYLLKGKIHCGECNSRFYGRKRQDLSDNQYICSSQRYSNEWCKTRGINIDYLDNLILQQIQLLPSEIVKFFEWFKSNDIIVLKMAELKSYRVKELKIKSKIENLINLGIDGSIKKDVFNTKMDELNSDLDEVLKRKSKALKNISLLNSENEIKNQIQSTIQKIIDPSLKKEQQRELIRTIINRIDIFWNNENLKHSVVIHYKIDKLIQFRIGKDIELGYKKQGWRLDRDGIIKNNFTIRRVISSEFLELFGENNDIPYITIT